MMANCYELESFVAKFRYLCSAGFDSTLTLSPKKGQAHVSFNVNLGFLPPPLSFPPPSTAVPATPCSRRRSPSYYRRLKRRSDARQNLGASYGCDVKNDEVISNEAEAENAARSLSNLSQIDTENETEVEEKSAVHRGRFSCISADKYRGKI